MEAKAQARFIRVTPQKSRRVVNEVRGKRVLEAADILRFAPQAVATDVRKVLLSAVANSKVKAENAGETFNEADHPFSPRYRCYPFQSCSQPAYCRIRALPCIDSPSFSSLILLLLSFVHAFSAHAYDKAFLR